MKTEEKGHSPFLDVLLSKQSASDHQGSFISLLFVAKRLTLIYLRMIVGFQIRVN